MYADKITDSMRVAIDETNRRREIQKAYNEAHGITPKTIEKAVREVMSVSKELAREEKDTFSRGAEDMDYSELEELAEKYKKKMDAAAADLNFEIAAEYRDRLVEVKNMLRDLKVDLDDKRQRKRNKK